jgi:hypothetical protein
MPVAVGELHPGAQCKEALMVFLQGVVHTGRLVSMGRYDPVAGIA